MMEPVLLCRSLEEWPKHRVGVVYIFGAGSIWYTSLLRIHHDGKSEYEYSQAGEHGTAAFPAAAKEVEEREYEAKCCYTTESASVGG